VCCSVLQCVVVSHSLACARARSLSFSLYVCMVACAYVCIIAVASSP